MADLKRTDMTRHSNHFPQFLIYDFQEMSSSNPFLVRTHILALLRSPELLRLEASALCCQGVVITATRTSPTLTPGDPNCNPVETQLLYRQEVTFSPI